ncbi:DNA methyltransferase, partial [Parageobacillus thermoglucosidasius]
MQKTNGSGTTGVVAKKLNRRYIGIDIEKEYLELTIKRLEATENE